MKRALIGCAAMLLLASAAGAALAIPYWTVPHMNRTLVSVNPQFNHGGAATKILRARCAGVGKAKIVRRQKRYNGFRCRALVRRASAVSNQVLWARPRPNRPNTVCVSTASLFAIWATGCLGNKKVPPPAGNDPRVCSLGDPQKCLLANAKLATAKKVESTYDPNAAYPVAGPTDCTGSGFSYRCSFRLYPIGGTQLTVAGTSAIAFVQQASGWATNVSLSNISCTDRDGHVVPCP